MSNYSLQQLQALRRAEAEKKNSQLLVQNKKQANFHLLNILATINQRPLPK